MKEKIPFKDYPLIHKIMLPCWYGMVALSALLTAYSAKNGRNIKEPACCFATLAVATNLYRVAARNEARQIKQNQRS